MARENDATRKRDVGRVIGDRFELLELAGAGGMARVFRAKDRSTGTDVALKLVLTAGEDDLARFFREAAVLADLSHPAIVRYLAHGRAPSGEPYLAMEWLEGEDLSSLLRSRRLSPAESLRVILQAARALGHAHARGVIHRDIKPSNLFLVEGDVDRLKVIDFGIARADFSQARLTVAGQVIGTPGYMSPEQVRGDDKLDARVDVFALGCVLYECIADRPPFSGADTSSLFGRVLLEEPAPLSELATETLPPGTDAVVSLLLAKAAEERPSDGQAAAAALHDVLAGRGNDAPAPARPPRTRLTSVLVAVDVPHTASTDGALTRVEAPHAAVRPKTALLDVLAPFEAQVEWSRDGVLLARFAGQGEGTDHVVLAARAAKRLLAAHPLALGIATGEAPIHRGAVSGEVVERAVRLAREAQRGTVRLDPTTAAIVERRFEVLSAAGEARLGEPLQWAPARPVRGQVLPHVGRSRELDSLRAVVGEAFFQPVARAALVTGPPGIGKSRLLAELVSVIEDAQPDTQTLLAAGELLSNGSPFLLLAQLLRAAFALSGHEAAEAVRDRMQERLGAATDAPMLAAFLTDVAGFALETDALRAARRDRELRAALIERATAAWLRAECAAHPLLLLVDDVQWADLASLRCIEAAMNKNRELCIAVVALGRPEARNLPGLFGEHLALELRLTPLVSSAVKDLVRAALGDAASPADLEEIARAGEGNPLLLEELLRAHGRAGAARGGLLALLQARIDALPAAAGEVLGAASVLGGAFWPGAVAAVLDLRSGSEVHERLLELIRHEMIAETPSSRFPGEAEYVFHHALLREAAYEKLPTADRPAAHRRVAHWLKSRPGADALAIAEHLRQGGDGAGAAQWYLAAASQGARGVDAGSVLSLCERGLGCGPAPETEAALRAVESEAAAWAGDQRRGLVAAQEVRRLSPAGSRLWYRMVRSLGYTYGQLGDAAKFDEICGSTLSTPCVPGAESDRLLALMDAAEMQIVLRGPSSGLVSRLVKEVNAAGSDRQTGDVRAAALMLQLVWRHGLGDAEGALALEAELFPLLRSVGDARGELMGRVYLARAREDLGELEAAEAGLREVLEHSGTAQILAAFARAYLASTLVRLGRPKEAVSAARQTIRDAGAAGLPGMAFDATVTLAEALRREGALAEARAEVAAGLERFAMISTLRPYALAVAARIELDAGRPAEALELARRAHDELARAPAYHGTNYVRWVYAQALSVNGRAPEAARVLEQARQPLLARAAKMSAERRAAFLSRVEENAGLMSAGP